MIDPATYSLIHVPEYLLIGLCCTMVLLRIQKAYSPLTNEDLYGALLFILIWPTLPAILLVYIAIKMSQWFMLFMRDFFDIEKGKES